MKKTIVIVDDHILIAKALQSIISNFNSFEVLYESENGKELQEKFEHKSNIPNIVLLDISMPIMNGFETAAWISKHHPNVLIMALSMQDDEQSVIKMIKNGSKGYLLKNTHPVELETALNTLVKNGSYYPDWVTGTLCANLIKNQMLNKSDINFSEREKEFLKYTITELTYREIADKMCCSPRTVEGYRDNLFEKLELKTRVGLAVFAMKNEYA
jgi:DNA-binding NarL/FixJ family response regulator